MYVRIVILLASCGTISVRAEDDPCYSQRIFPKTVMGSRNEKCPVQSNTVCDYYLPEDWYRVKNGQVLTTCPSSGSCGVSFPAWINGSLPSEEDGIVNMTVCVKHSHDCCNVTLTTRVKRCKGFHVFYLIPLNECPAGYCIESNIPCGQPPQEPPKPVVDDPCKKTSVFPKSNFGSRNGHCQPQSSPVCDYYLPEDWYRVEEGAMLTRCPSGTCGVAYPVWLNGSLPRTSEGIVERNACLKDGANCCKSTVKVKIKACSRGYIYNLQPLAGCPYAYCFESNQPCIAPTTPSTDGNASKVDPDDSPSVLMIALTVGVVLVLIIVLGIACKLCLQNGKKSRHRVCVSKKRVMPHTCTEVKTIQGEKTHAPEIPASGHNTPLTPPPAYSDRTINSTEITPSAPNIPADSLAPPAYSA